jgi:diguanylate cyclase (GGDEF)-like protein
MAEAAGKADRLQLLGEIGRVVSSTLDLHTLYRTIYQQISRVMDATQFYIGLHHPETKSIFLPLVYEAGIVFCDLDVPFGNNLTSHVIEHGVPLLFNTDAEYMEFVRRNGLPEMTLGQAGSEAKLWVPLATPSRIIGALSVQSAHPNAYAADDLNTLSVIAAQAAIAVENARLFEEQQAQVTELRALERALRASEERLRYLALHDTLTDLPNRTLLNDRLEEAIAAAQVGGSVALFLMDLDRFKDINDTFGHHHGDVLLREVANRLRQALRDTDTIGRLGGDEFAAVLPEVDRVEAGEVAERLTDVLASSIHVAGQTFEIGASIGIAFYPEHGEDAQTLLQHADVAMYEAKRDRACRYMVYAPGQGAQPESLILIRDLRHAIEHKQLVLHYQPAIHVGTGDIACVEALVRWNHPERGLLAPDTFISLAEETGLIHPLTTWVLEEALKECGTWHERGFEAPVAVNLAASSLQDRSLIATVRRALRRCGGEPSWLVLEITESAVMAHPETAIDVLSNLHDLGVRVAIDDFGTGYSSLSYLRILPVDTVKIDRSFVRYLGTVDADRRIVRGTINLGHDLGLQVVAEGVEDAHSYDLLGSMGCDVAQGYYLSHPVPAADLASFMATLGDMRQESRPA